MSHEDAHAETQTPPPGEQPSEPTPQGDVVKPATEAVTVTAQEYERLLEQAKQAEQYLRQLADADNTRKRLQREKEEFGRFATESMIRHLLPIVDSLSQALVAVDKQADPQTIIKGIHLIYRQLLGLLEREGVARITTIGEPFDPHRHEAVAQVDTDDHKADGTIVEEVHVGYTMHGKVLRPAMVKIAKKTAGSVERRAESDQKDGE